MNLDKLDNLKPTPKIQALLSKRMWMRFILTGIMFGSFYWVVWLLFTDFIMWIFKTRVRFYHNGKFKESYP